MQYINRALEEVILRSDKTFKALLITGARQVGKTETIKTIFANRNYVLLDDPYLEEQAKSNPNNFLMLNQPPVIYDEVQRTPELFRFIKIACDESKNNGLFCLSGSQPLELMRNVSESLSGRIAIIEMSPLSGREIDRDSFNLPFLPTMEYIQKRNESAKVPKNIWERIHRGGYPALQDPEVEWAMFFSSYVRTYLERDVRDLTAVQDLSDFRRFMVAVAARTGQVVNYSNIADEIGKGVSTVKAWMSILETTNIIYLLEPYAASPLKKAIKTPKVYFRDTGLAAYLTRWLTPDTLANGAMNGAFFETYVIGEILKSYSNRGLDYRLNTYYYRGRDKVKRDGQSIEGEIDLIIEQDGILYPLEIKLSSNPIAEDGSTFTVLDKIPEKKRGTGAIICLCSKPGILRENVYSIPVWYI